MANNKKVTIDDTKLMFGDKFKKSKPKKSNSSKTKKK